MTRGYPSKVILNTPALQPGSFSFTYLLYEATRHPTNNDVARQSGSKAADIRGIGR
jgi:hypothetical protein